MRSQRLPRVIDAHAHLDAAFGGGWIDRPAAALVEVLDTAGVDLLVDLSGGWGVDTLHRHLDHFKAHAPDRFAMFGGVDWGRWPVVGSEFPRTAARSLSQQLDRGATGLKVWKTLGLEARDHLGALVTIDDPRLTPLWDVCADRRVPVVIHVGDPPDFFRPIGPDNPRSEELSRSPEWHWLLNAPVTFASLTAQADRLFGAHPDVQFIGAHGLDLLTDPWRLDALLHRHQNLSVDLGARFDELGGHDPRLLSLLVRYPDRILYGMDHPPGVEMYDATVASVVRALEHAYALAGRPEAAAAAIADALHGNAARRVRP